MIAIETAQVQNADTDVKRQERWHNIAGIRLLSEGTGRVLRIKGSRGAQNTADLSGARAKKLRKSVVVISQMSVE
ncbi:hypothetical protein [Roseobacter weihaiensis]|uniref:hypothetical protein n=1 Tax=Roseobacter weihaiensis TaxID=2763262 RepID=UPI001D0AE92E|nr:hypothetical protein [Roseobacter sp. H9]